MLYPLVRSFLFNFPAEDVHYFAMNSLRKGNDVAFIKSLIRSSFQYSHPSLEKKLFGLHFQNPVGLGAGFDKNAVYLRELAALGFGFVEIGTVTPQPQPGNDKPRLFRLPADKALINRMGFNNNGVKAIKGRLMHWNDFKQKNPACKLIVGGNIGKNKITPNEDAWKDYETCFIELFDYVDYFVVNVSSPNTPGLRELQEKESLGKILSHLQEINQAKPKPKPLLLKIAPDLTTEQLNDIVELSFQVKLDGLVATNTTISRDNLKTGREKIQAIGAGGLSGAPLKEKSTDVVRHLVKETNGQIPVIASGGIFKGADATEKLKVGASLIQVWTGFIYEGPAIAKNICKYLIDNQIN